ncbi:GntR family transcriptional regulator [Streptomyces cinereospinus]|uniref:GntR family transcriptional regulator n=1 Tax=Streptomyces cinereospinus TaxID=285561 RepID=A0ABV5MW35_9ACTN
MTAIACPLLAPLPTTEVSHNSSQNYGARILDPQYQVAAGLRRRLDAGTYPPGERFPAVAELATELDGAPSTVQKAVAAPREEGRLYTVLGQGSFVSKP